MSAFLRYALSLRGQPYEWQGSTSGFDCSAFVRWAEEHA